MPGGHRGYAGVGPRPRSQRPWWFHGRNLNRRNYFSSAGKPALLRTWTVSVAFNGLLKPPPKGDKARTVDDIGSVSSGRGRHSRAPSREPVPRNYFFHRYDSIRLEYLQFYELWWLGSNLTNFFSCRRGNNFNVFLLGSFVWHGRDNKMRGGETCPEGPSRPRLAACRNAILMGVGVIARGSANWQTRHRLAWCHASTGLCTPRMTWSRSSPRMRYTLRQNRAIQFRYPLLEELQAHHDTRAFANRNTSIAQIR